MSDRELEQLRRRYERERKARAEAELIAERVTSQLYAATQEQQRLNTELARANEGLQAANQAIRDFVAVASHDFRGPLTSILGSAQLLLHRWNELLDDKKLDFLGIVVRQSQHLARLADDLLTVSRIEAGALDTHAQAVRLREALDMAIEEFAQHSAEVRVETADDLEVLADPDHLRRIITNFIGNAFKYGAPPVEVRACMTDGWIEIRVCDHGEGVPEDFVPRLFGKFARAETDATRAHRGTGLGLSIVRGLARANGGEVWYEPNTPRGSIFAVRLKAAAA